MITYLESNAHCLLCQQLDSIPLRCTCLAQMKHHCSIACRFMPLCSLFHIWTGGRQQQIQELKTSVEKLIHLWFKAQLLNCRFMPLICSKYGQWQQANNRYKELKTKWKNRYISGLELRRELQHAKNHLGDKAIWYLSNARLRTTYSSSASDYLEH